MDLRVKKTLKNIKDSFYQLRKRKPIEKISVKELSEMAIINKATFYLHYRDVYDLSDKLKNELVAEIIDDVRQYDLSRGKSEFRLFAENLCRSIIAHTEEIKTLYSDLDDNSDIDANEFFYRLEDSVKEYIFRRFPNIPHTSEINIIFTLFIQGSSHVLLRNSTTDPELLISTTTLLFMRLIDV